MKSPRKICQLINLEHDLMCHKNLCRCKYDKNLEKRSFWMWTGPKWDDECTNKRQKRRWRRHTGEKSMWKWRKRLEWCTCNSRNAEDCQQLLDTTIAIRASLGASSSSNSPIDTLISVFCPLELWENIFLLFQATKLVAVCYISLSIFHQPQSTFPWM